MTTLVRALAASVFTITLSAADPKTEIAELNESLNRASLAHDADAYLKLMASDFHSITRTGIVRDR